MLNDGVLPSYLHLNIYFLPQSMILFNMSSDLGFPNRISHGLKVTFSRCFKNLHPCENLHCIGCKFAPTFEVEQIYLDPGTNLHPGANCAYEHGLSVVVSKLQPSVCGNPWPDPESFDPPPLSCLDLII